jgi:hypothetical protein
MATDSVQAGYDAGVSQPPGASKVMNVPAALSSGVPVATGGGARLGLVSPESVGVGGADLLHVARRFASHKPEAPRPKAGRRSRI